MPRRSLADEAKLEALRIAELCRLMNRDAAVRRRLRSTSSSSRAPALLHCATSKRQPLIRHNINNMPDSRAGVAAVEGVVAVARSQILARTAPPRQRPPKATLLPHQPQSNSNNTRSSCLS